MATVIKGKNGVVRVDVDGAGAGAGVNLVSVTSWSATLEADTLETTAFGNAGWKTFCPSMLSWSGSFEGFMDTTNTLSYEVGDKIEVSLEMSDDSSSPIENIISGMVVVTSKSIEVSSADLVTVSVDFTGDGEWYATDQTT
jgi:hypothetical protein